MIAIELFAGLGGASLGIRRAGIESIACVEREAAPCRVLRAHGFPAVESDVRAVDWTATLGGRSVDLAWTSPPCQDWSTAGKRRGASGDRNGWPWTFAALDAIQPTWAIAENVPGMTYHASACRDGCCRDPLRCPAAYFDAIVLAEFRRRFAVVEWRILDAADYGIPQFRRRVFVVAGPRRIRWPESTHGDPAAHADLFRRTLPWVSVREALGLGDIAARNSGQRGACAVSPDRPSPTMIAKSTCGGWDALTTVGSGLRGGEWGSDAPSPTLRDSNGTSGLWLQTEQRGAVAQSADIPAPTQPTTGNQYLHAADPGARRAAEPWRLNAPAPAVATTEEKGSRAEHIRGGPDRASDALWLATGRRRLTVEECEILQGLPPGWSDAAGTKTARYRGVGNAVVPEVARLLAAAVGSA